MIQNSPNLIFETDFKNDLQLYKKTIWTQNPISNRPETPNPKYFKQYECDDRMNNSR